MSITTAVICLGVITAVISRIRRFRRISWRITIISSWVGTAMEALWSTVTCWCSARIWFWRGVITITAITIWIITRFKSFSTFRTSWIFVCTRWRSARRTFKGTGTKSTTWFWTARTWFTTATRARFTTTRFSKYCGTIRWIYISNM